MKTILLSLLFFVTVLMQDSKANNVVYIQPPQVVYQQTVMVYQTQYYTVTIPVVQQYQVQQIVWYPYQPAVVPVIVNPYYQPVPPRRCRLFNY